MKFNLRIINKQMHRKEKLRKPFALYNTDKRNSLSSKASFSLISYFLYQSAIMAEWRIYQLLEDGEKPMYHSELMTLLSQALQKED